MIEINLSPTKKDASLTNIGGIDLSLINVKMFVVALLLLYVPEGIISSYYEEQVQAEQQTQTKLNQEFRSLKTKVSSLSNIKKQVDALKDQEEKLARKLDVVKEVINKRQNPFKVLKYIADNTPEDLWLVSMEINERDLVMRGYSKNFKNIGAFLENLKNSIFFTKDISYSRPEGMPETVDGVYLEVFEVKAKVASFE